LHREGLCHQLKVITNKKRTEYTSYINENKKETVEKILFLTEVTYRLLRKKTEVFQK
jgi:hypothetical protein